MSLFTTNAEFNTAHKYFSQLENIVEAKLLNIVDITVGKILEGAKKITVLATRSTMEIEIYQYSICKHGKKVEFRGDWQNMVDKIISDIKSKRQPLT